MTVKIWSPATGECLATLNGHASVVYAVAWSHDGKQLAASSQDGQKGTIRIWDVANGECISTIIAHNHLVLSLAWSHTGGRHLASGSLDRSAKIWDTATGQCISTLSLAHISSYKSRINSLAWSLDGTKIAVGLGNGTVGIWNPTATSWQAVHIASQDDRPVTPLGWSHDGTRLAFIMESRATIWDLATNRCIAHPWRSDRLAGHRIACVAWSHSHGVSELLAAGLDDGTIRIWNSITESVPASVELRGHYRNVYAVAWSE
jgi:WD40 repeat protein